MARFHYDKKMTHKTRLEKDALGNKEIPQKAYYGIQTLRAVENFPISGWTAQSAYLKSIVIIKKAAAQVNAELGLIPSRKAKLIQKSCDEILTGNFSDQFPVDVFQAGAGTSQNMNVNEVIANRANEIAGFKKGSYTLIHPNDDVNCSQSTNDVIPTAIRLAALQELESFYPVFKKLIQSFQNKEKEFSKIIKSGRTHLQDATPLFLGQEFSGYTQILKNHLQRIQAAGKGLLALGIGGTAVGTGLNTAPTYSAKMIQSLRKATKLPLQKAPNFFEVMQSFAPFCEVSSALNNLCLDLLKISNDFRLLSSGPRTGLSEIELPARQPGSSIMPGKVNPVMAEMLSMVCVFVSGLNHTISMASQAGHLELNVMLPVVAYSLPWSIILLSHSLDVFESFCVRDITANEARCRYYAENSVSIATVLSPLLGYSKTSEIVKKAVKSGKEIRQILLEEKLLTKQEIAKAFELSHLTKPNL